MSAEVHDCGFQITQLAKQIERLGRPPSHEVEPIPAAATLQFDMDRVRLLVERKPTRSGWVGRQEQDHVLLRRHPSLRWLLHRPIRRPSSVNYNTLGARMGFALLALRIAAGPRSDLRRSRRPTSAQDSGSWCASSTFVLKGLAALLAAALPFAAPLRSPDSRSRRRARPCRAARCRRVAELEVPPPRLLAVATAAVHRAAAIEVLAGLLAVAVPATVPPPGQARQRRAHAGRAPRARAVDTDRLGRAARGAPWEACDADVAIAGVAAVAVDCGLDGPSPR